MIADANANVNEIRYNIHMHEHACPTCDLLFNSTKRISKKTHKPYTESAHHATYNHMLKIHSMRINTACHAKCVYISEQG